MVRAELWTTLLGYNLIRTTTAAAAILHQKIPRQISFTATCQQVLANWMLPGSGKKRSYAEYHGFCQVLLQAISNCPAAERPGRIEPREVKRRLDTYKRMTEPRSVLRARLLGRK